MSVNLKNIIIKIWKIKIIMNNNVKLKVTTFFNLVRTISVGKIVLQSLHFLGEKVADLSTFLHCIHSVQKHRVNPLISGSVLKVLWAGKVPLRKGNYCVGS